MEKRPAFANIRQFINLLRLKGELVDIYAEVDPYLEIAEIHRRVIGSGGPALFFHRVQGSTVPVVTNLYGTEKRVALCFGDNPEEIISPYLELLKSPPSLSTLWEKRKTIATLRHIGSKKVKKSQLQSNVSPDLTSLPFLTSWPEDGGAFLTTPLVYTESPSGKGPNLGMYRIQRLDPQHLGLHFQIGKGGGFHYFEAEEKQIPLEVTIFLGGPPTLLLSAIAPLPENLSELLLASFLEQKKLKVSYTKGRKHPLIEECEFAFCGRANPNQRRAEGPFGDHYGYYSLQHDYPFMLCEQLYSRKDPIFPATIVGKPKQEDFFIGAFLQKLLSPLFPLAMPMVKDLWSYGETGFHSLASARVAERYGREAMMAMFRILGEGQLSFTKSLFLTDQNVNLQNFREVFQKVFERIDPKQDLWIFSNLSMDTLDYTGPKINEGSRVVFAGVGEKKRELFDREPQTIRGIKKAKLFCPGLLVIETCSYLEQKDPSSLLEHPDLMPWSLIVLVDDCERATRSEMHFLWTAFTRFEPAADLYAKKASIHRHHLQYDFPILIDARMKPWYPKEVEVDHETANKVTKRWKEYFAETLEMNTESF